MNKSELIKKIAIQMVHYYLCGKYYHLCGEHDLPQEFSTPSNKAQKYNWEDSIKPDHYKPFIPLAEIFVNKLIKDKVI